jgi:hypothetical protein
MLPSQSANGGLVLTLAESNHHLMVASSQKIMFQDNWNEAELPNADVLAGLLLTESTPPRHNNQIYSTRICPFCLLGIPWFKRAEGSLVTGERSTMTIEFLTFQQMRYLRSTGTVST